MSLADNIINVESGGDPNAQNPLSSASGPGQFIDSTWLSMVKQHAPDVADGKSDAEILALKSDPTLSRQMTAAYAADNAAVLSKNGLPVTPGTTYLAHFAGPQGAVGILNADPNAPAASVLGQGFAKANPSLAGYTAGQLAAWASRKMGGAAPMSMAGPQTASQSAPTAPAPTQAPVQNSAPAAPAAAASPPPFSIAALAATPKLQNILPNRPNPYGLKIAPFSLGGSA